MQRQPFSTYAALNWSSTYMRHRRNINQSDRQPTSLSPQKYRATQSESPWSVCLFSFPTYLNFYIFFWLFFSPKIWGLVVELSISLSPPKAFDESADEKKGKTFIFLPLPNVFFIPFGGDLWFSTQLWNSVFTVTCPFINSLSSWSHSFLCYSELNKQGILSPSWRWFQLGMKTCLWRCNKHDFE